MATERKILLRIKEWLFEYSAKFGMVKVVKEIVRNHKDLWREKQCTINPVFPLLMILEDVVNTRDVERYPEAIKVMDFIQNELGDLLCMETYWKLQLRLRILILFEMLRKDDRTIIQKVNSYFPRTGIVCPSLVSSRSKILLESSKLFRDFFLTLVFRPSIRAKYMEEDFENDYGQKFQAKMEKFVKHFICNVHWIVPPTVLERILQKPADETLLKGLTSLRSTYLTILFENLETFDIFDESKVLKLTELFHHFSQEEMQETEGPETRGLISAYSLALTRGGSGLNLDSLFHFINQHRFDDVDARDDDVANREAAEEGSGLLDGPSEVRPSGSQPPTWSSLGDIPSDISKCISDSTNESRGVAPAPPLKPFSPPREAEGISQNFADPQASINFPDLSEVGNESNVQKKFPTSTTSLHSQKVDGPEVTGLAPLPDELQAHASSRNDKPTTGQGSEASLRKPAFNVGTATARVNENINRPEVALQANEVLVHSRNIKGKPTTRKRSEDNPCKPAIIVYRRESKRKLDENIDNIQTKGTSSSNKRKKGRSKSPSPTNRKRARIEGPATNTKKDDGVCFVRTDEKRAGEDHLIPDVVNNILEVNSDGRHLDKPDQEASGENYDNQSDGENLLSIISSSDEAPPQDIPPTSVSKEFDSSFEKCIPHDFSKLDAILVREQRQADHKTSPINLSGFQSSPDELQLLSQDFVVPRAPSKSRTRLEDNDAELHSPVERQKAGSPSLLPSQVTSSWGSSCSSSKSHGCLVEPSDACDVSEADLLLRESENYGGSLSHYFEGTRRSNEEMRSEAKKGKSPDGPMRRSGLESVLAIDQKSSRGGSLTQFFSQKSSQPCSSSSDSFYSCLGPSQQSRAEVVDLSLDGDLSWEHDVTVMEVKEEEIIEPADDAPGGSRRGRVTRAGTDVVATVMEEASHKCCFTEVNEADSAQREEGRRSISNLWGLLQ